MAEAFISGMSQVGEALKRLPIAIKDKIATGAMRKAAQVGRDAVQQESTRHYRTGEMYHAVRIAKRRRGVGPFEIQYVVYISASFKGAKRGAYYWYYIEFGTHNADGSVRIGADPFVERGFQKSAANAATQARDYAAAAIARGELSR